MIRIETHIVPQLQFPVRISDYAIGIFENKPSRKGIKKAIKKGLVFINDKKAYTADYLNGAERIDLFFEENTLPEVKPDFDVDIVYKDPYLCVVNKPAGIVVSGNKARTLSNFVCYTLEPSDQKDALPYPMPVHRLDYPTSGLVVFARTVKALHGLNQLFRLREIEKNILCYYYWYS